MAEGHWAIEAPRANASEAKRADARARRMRAKYKKAEGHWAIEAPRANASEAKRADARARRMRE